jgi:site-specific recombinase XerC
VPHPHALGSKDPNAPVERDQDIRTIQELLGHKDVQT